MVSLKPTFIITAVFIKTLIVLTFTDLVFSDDIEKGRCILYIREIYGNTDPGTMFRIGFYQFNRTKIEEKNVRIVLQKNDDDVWILEKMNHYTYGYFLAVLDTVVIPDKNEISTPRRHCKQLFEFYENENILANAVNAMPGVENEEMEERLFNEVINDTTTKVDKCTDFLLRKFLLEANLHGGEIFDTFYKFWIDDDVISLEDRHPNDGFGFVEEDIIDAISSFYNEYETALNEANVNGMITPEDYCAEITAEKKRRKIKDV